ncbi:phosphoprotein [Avian paramyxovirus 17]|uniref:Phosphoprotein n=1 Tax=Avian paramyxovirus 17 TaxID=2094282 RepID=A0A2L2FM62_9MONO|nr:phosphoprotein [Avian paramyxovirus 17]AVG72385.1 phosphoprotein [Avian paramyxovirus 17]
MATFTDDEISDLMEQSGLVIDEIMTAQGKPKETLGRSAIPAGKAQSLTNAWERHTRQSADNTAHTENTRSRSEAPLDSHGGDSAETANREAGSPQAGTSQGSDMAPGPQGAEPEIQQGATSGLLDMLDKIAAKQTRAKKGQVLNDSTPQGGRGRTTPGHPGGTPEHQGPSPPPQGPTQVSNKAPPPPPQGTGRATSPPTPAPHHHNPREASPPTQAEEGGIGESTAWSGAQEASSRSAGATPSAHPSLRTPESYNASAAAAPSFADFAQAVLAGLENIQHRLMRIEHQVDLSLRHAANIPAMRSDVQQLKTAMAVFEANIGMMKILDPGSAHISSLNDLRAVARSHPVLLAGPGDPSKVIAEDGSLSINRLAQPNPDQRALVRELAPPQGDIEAERCAIRALIDARPMHPNASSRLISRLEQARTSEELKKLKRLVLNN